jgi:hypothetical protein
LDDVSQSGPPIAYLKIVNMHSAGSRRASSGQAENEDEKLARVAAINRFYIIGSREFNTGVRMLRALSVIVICGTAMMGSSQSNPPNEARSSSPATVVPHQTPTKSTAIIGLGGVKEKTAGTLNVKDGKLCFVHSGNKSQISVAAIAEVVTSEDSQRVIRGTLGTLSMFAPYESGRAISMLRSKIDILTIQYRDDDGGLHGVIFTMPVGAAEPIKQELITLGAHTTIQTAAVAARGKQ